MADPKWEDTEPLYDETSDIEEVPSLPEDAYAYAPEDRVYSELDSAGLTGSGVPVGLPQGLTLGFGDEIAGLSGALGAKSGGDPRDFWDIYANIRDVGRAEAAQATEQNPMSALAGELVGGLAVPIGVGTAAKTGMTAAKIGKARGVVKAGGAAIREARILREMEKIKDVAKIGAQAGAVAGLGTSEADLTTGEPGQFLQAAKDTAGGAVIGGSVGGTVQTLGKGIQLGGRAIKNLPYVEDAFRIRELVKLGHAITGEAKNISQEAREQAYKILGKLETLRTFTGTLVGKAKEEADKLVGKIRIKEVIDNLRKEINDLKPIGAAEKEDVANIQQVLSDILGETEKVTYRYIPKGKLPKATSADKASQKIAKKTAEAEAKDKIKLGELYEALQKTSDPDEAEGIIAQIRKLESGETSFPPETIAEEATGLPVLGVSRGPKKAPLVEAITPDAEEVFTPIQRVEVGREVTPGRTEATPGELSSLLQTLRDVPVSTSKGQRGVGMVNEALRDAEKAAAQAAGPEATQAASLLQEANAGFGGIKDVQRSLGLPQSGKAFDPSQEKNIVDTIQRAILNLSENKISSDRFMEITRELGEQFPQAAREIQDITKGISERFQLSKMLSAQSLEGVKRGGLAIPAMIGRATEAGTRAEQAIIKTATKAGAETKNKIVDLGKKFYDASPDQIQALADKAGSLGTAFGDATKNTLGRIATAPMAKRKALIFTLMQQSDFRDLAKDMFDFSDSEE